MKAKDEYDVGGALPRLDGGGLPRPQRLRPEALLDAGARLISAPIERCVVLGCVPGSRGDCRSPRHRGGDVGRLRQRERRHALIDCRRVRARRDGRGAVEPGHPCTSTEAP